MGADFSLFVGAAGIGSNPNFLSLEFDLDQLDHHDVAIAQDNMRRSQERYARQANKRRREPDFTFPCTVSRNGIGINTISLLDTGASAFSLADITFVELCCTHLGIPKKKLPRPVRVKGFDGNIAQEISEYIELNLHIDGRVVKNIPMLIVKLGGHDLILGRTW